VGRKKQQPTQQSESSLDVLEMSRDELIKKTISGVSTKREYISWNRKHNNIKKLIDDLQPVEQEILDLQATRMGLLEQINEIRQLMVNQCIHPYEMLSVKEKHVECKFCNKKISMPKVSTNESQV
jgi:transcription termination factor NusB